MSNVFNLIQIWAYSRMTVGRPIKRGWEGIEFAFPLFKMWKIRLGDHYLLNDLISVREELDKQHIDNVIFLSLFFFFLIYISFEPLDFTLYHFH